jgi:hypothetical protein
VPSRHRLAAATLVAVAIACLSAAFLTLLPRIRLGGPIEGVQWVQALGSTFFALPVTFCALVGAGGLLAMASVLGIRSRMLTAAFVGSGAVAGAGAFVAIGTPWYQHVDGVSVESLLLGLAAFLIAASLYLVASRRVAVRSG